MFGPANYGNGVNVWCINQRNGSYGSSFFVHTESWVNYGGTCNGQWGRPAGDLKSRVLGYNGGSLLSNSGWVDNAANAHTVQADVLHLASVNIYKAQSQFYSPANGWIIATVMVT